MAAFRALLFIAVVTVCAVAEPAGSGSEYVFGMWYPTSNEQAGQAKTITSETLDVFHKKSGIAVDFKWYLELEDFIKDVEKHELDFIYVLNSDRILVSDVDISLG